MRWIFFLSSLTNTLSYYLLNVEGLKLGKGEFLRRYGARFVSEEAVRRFLLIASFRTELRSFRVSVLWRRFLIQRLNILYFFMFSRTNLLNIVDRLVKKNETKTDAVVSKKQVSLIEKIGFKRKAQAVQLGYTANFQERAAVCDALAALFSLYSL